MWCGFCILLYDIESDTLLGKSGAIKNAQQKFLNVKVHVPGLLSLSISERQRHF